MTHVLHVRPLLTCSIHLSSLLSHYIKCYAGVIGWYSPFSSKTCPCAVFELTMINLRLPVPLLQLHDRSRPACFADLFTVSCPDSSMGLLGRCRSTFTFYFFQHCAKNTLSCSWQRVSKTRCCWASSVLVYSWAEGPVVIYHQSCITRPTRLHLVWQWYFT